MEVIAEHIDVAFVASMDKLIVAVRQLAGHLLFRVGVSHRNVEMPVLFQRPA
ncbi:hypothetical protein D3C84_1199820 [compost metagenome]